MSLVIYDTETTGTGKFFDQILQFAAIKTDEDLKELDSFEIRCRLMPHVVPAPGAMSVTRVKASQLTDAAYPSHYEMVRAMAARLESWSPALFLGWNSIKFDEELVRQALYKTLHNPYLTNTSKNTRSDAMRIVQACALFAPGALVIPTDAAGKQVFKLDQIAPANGFAHDDAHDAMGDVRATIFLCRMIAERASHVWSAFMRFSKKTSVIDYINEEPVFCLSEYYFGNPHSFIVSAIGASPENPGNYYVFDLGVDPDSLRGLSDSELSAFVGQSPKPVRKLKCNAAPMIFPADEAPECCPSRDLGMDELCRRAEVLRSDAELRNRLITAADSKGEEYPPSTHVEQQIYDGFYEDEDKMLMTAFHNVAWPNRPAIVENFQDSRLRTIGRQLIFLERPDLLDKNVRHELDLATAKRVLGQGEDIPWLTIPAALLELQAMSQDLSGDDLQHLCEHEHYLRARLEQARATLNAG